MNNRGYPAPAPSSPGLGGLNPSYSPPPRSIAPGSPGDASALGAAIRESEARPLRPRPLSFPKIPYRKPPFRLSYGTHPWLRALDLLNTLQPLLMRGGVDGGYDMTGWTLCGDSGHRPLDAARFLYGNASANDVVCIIGFGVPLIGQVPSHQAGEALPNPDQSGGIGQYRFRTLYLGPTTAGSPEESPWRMIYA